MTTDLHQQPKDIIPGELLLEELLISLKIIHRSSKTTKKLTQSHHIKILFERTKNKTEETPDEFDKYIIEYYMNVIMCTRVSPGGQHRRLPKNAAWTLDFPKFLYNPHTF